MSHKIIAVDFDGTLVIDKYPDIGDINTELIAGLLYAQSMGHKIVLWTCRNGQALEEAVNCLKDNGLVCDAVNENLPHIKELYGGDTRKVYADIYIDDKASGVFTPGGKPYGVYSLESAVREGYTNAVGVKYAKVCDILSEILTPV